MELQMPQMQIFLFLMLFSFFYVSEDAVLGRQYFFEVHQDFSEVSAKPQKKKIFT